eukprot:TRINITY_DN2148_c1_g1_i2.p2 TRINITY_DN2148_c1_g1~~TRINITY_DN2148_c1_g1_i2.p2  ORF type:complete len:272 (-),score=17.23 TRINITY_DN2148_c1_g1_i2:231-1046(-)
MFYLIPANFYGFLHQQRHDHFQLTEDAFQNAASYGNKDSEVDLKQEDQSDTKTPKILSRSLQRQRSRLTYKEIQQNKTRSIQIRAKRVKELNQKIQELNKQAFLLQAQKTRKKKSDSQNEAQNQDKILPEQKSKGSHRESKIFVERVQRVQEVKNNSVENRDCQNNLGGQLENQKQTESVQKSRQLEKCGSSNGGSSKVSFKQNKLDKQTTSLQLVIDKVVNAGIRVGALCSCSVNLDFTDVNYCRNCCSNCELFNRPDRHQKLLERLLIS